MPSDVAPGSRRRGSRGRCTANGPFDPWLSLFEDRLTELDRACGREGEAALPRFRELDDDLWTVLLTRSYETLSGHPGR